MSKPAPDPRIALLPGQLRPVAELCGFEGVEALIEHWGGMRVYVPSVVVSAAIARKCGNDVASALRQCYGGDYVVVPLARTLAKARKHDSIRRDTRPASEIAREWHMSVHSVYRIRGQAPAGAVVVPPAAAPRKARPDLGIIDIEEMIDRRRKA